MPSIRVRFTPTIWANDRLEISGLFGLCSARNAAKQSQILAPSPARFRKMLAGIRERLQLPVESLAMLFGTPLVTVRKWLNGERKPSGAAKRLVWMIHSALFNPAVLGKLDCWTKWAGNDEEALGRSTENFEEQKDSTSVPSLPTQGRTRRGATSVRVRRERDLTKLGEHVGGDLRYVGIAMLATGAVQLNQSIQQCEEYLSREGLNVETKLKLLDLKLGFVAQQITLAGALSHVAPGKSTADSKGPKQASFAPGEKVCPFSNQSTHGKGAS